MQLSFTTNFKDTEVMLQRMEAQLPVKQRELLDALTPRFIAIQEESLRRETPHSDRANRWLPAGEDTRSLEDTTVTETIRQGSNQFESRALLRTYQTKMVLNSKGKAFELSDVRVQGRDTEKVEPIRPAVKGALYWEELGHPIGQVAGSIVQGDDYFARAQLNALPQINAAAAQGVASMSDSLFTLR